MELYPAPTLRTVNFPKSSQIVKKYFNPKFQHKLCRVCHCFLKFICYLKHNDFYVLKAWPVLITIFSCCSVCGEVKTEIRVT